MAVKPNSYMFEFFDIPIQTISGNVVYINLGKYLSTNTGRSDKKKVWGRLQAFLRHASSDKTNAPFQQGEWIVDPRLQPHGRVKYSWTKTLGPFNGKGLPENYKRFLHVVDLWLKVGCEGNYKRWYRPDTWTTVLSLQQFADTYMGVDCNGFVGGFFEANYSGTGWDTSVDWNNKGLKGGPKRKSIDEVQPLDVLVRYKSSGNKHVAVIDDIWGKSGSKATVFMSQSANSKGGLWGGVCTLEITTTGAAKTSGGYNLEFDEGAFGVTGANS